MIIAFIVLKEILNRFGEKMVEERKKMTAFYGLFVFFNTIHVVYLFAYGHYYKIACNPFRRHIVENALYLVWDVPMIILVCHSHHTNFREKTLSKENMKLSIRSSIDSGNHPVDEIKQLERL